MVRLSVLLVMGLLAAAPVRACETSVAEGAELAIAAFDMARAVRKVEAAKAAAFLPERVVLDGAAAAGTSPEEYRQVLTRVLRSDLLELGFTAYELHHEQAVCGTIAGGVRYWLVPSSGTIAEVGGGGMADRNLFLAFPEDGRLAMIAIGRAFWRTELFWFYPAFAADPDIAAALDGRS